MLDLVGFPRRNWRWLLVLSCVPLFATKTLFNLPVALMAIMGVVRLKKAPSRYTSDPALRLVFLFFLCFWIPMWLSLPDAVDFRRSLTTTLVWLRFPLAAVFVRDVLREEVARRRLLWGVGLLVCAWSLDAIGQLAVGANFLGYPYDGGRLTGIFYPKLRLGTVTAVFVPVYLAWVRVATSKRWWLWPLLVAPVLAVVLLSGNRTGWLMLAVGAAMYGVGRLTVLDRKTALTWGAVFSLILSVIAVAVLGHQHFRERVEVTLNLASGSWKLADEATSGRLSIWATTLNMAKAHWLNGVGPRGFRKPYLTYADERDALAAAGNVPTHPHQFVLEIFAETGLLGLSGYSLFWWLLLSRFGPQIWRAGEAAPWVVAVVVAAFPLNVHMSLYASYWSSVLWWFLTVGVAAGVPACVQQRSAGSRRP